MFSLSEAEGSMVNLIVNIIVNTTVRVGEETASCGNAGSV